MRGLPAEKIATFLERYADRIDAKKDVLSDAAFAETGLARTPRLADIELPRTSNQLRTAAAACRSGSWALPTIDTKAGIRSCYEPLGPICVFGPNNFPFAFGSLSGGDFAAAIAAGNPVIGKKPIARIPKPLVCLQPRRSKRSVKPACRKRPCN